MTRTTAGFYAGASWLAATLALGCGQEAPPLSVPGPQALPKIGSTFDPSSAGQIEGTVNWAGDAPAVPPFEVGSLVTDARPARPRFFEANPNVPCIDAKTGGVAGAVVFLREVAPNRSRPWDHPPVVVEHKDRKLQIVQGPRNGNTGFVRVGEAVEIVSREKHYNSCRASGAAFFTLALPDADKPAQRVLRAKGLVEWSSAAGYYWMRGYLFVTDHPYYVRTDADGRFVLPSVPPGKYELVCWLPNWRIGRQERDPESGLVVRLSYLPPLEIVRPVEVQVDGTAVVAFQASQADFAK